MSPGVDVVVQMLRADIEHYDDLVRAALAHIDRILLAAFSIAGIAAPLLVTNKQYGVLLAVPFVAFGALFMGLNASGEMFALAAHKFFLESQLAEFLRTSEGGAPTAPPRVPWDLAGGYLRRRSLTYVALQGMYLLGLVVATIASLVIAWDKAPSLRWASIATSVVVVGLSVLTWSCWSDVQSTYERTLDRLRNLASGAPPESPEGRAT